MKSYAINASGLALNAEFLASPNYDARPALVGRSAICLIVIHNISLPPGQYGGNGIVDYYPHES